jgi:Mg-chelatase subunit ChlD
MSTPPLAALPPWLADGWPAALLGLAGLAALLAALSLRGRRPGLAFALLVAGPALVVFAAGGLALPGRLAGWLTLGAAGAFAVAGVLLLLTGAWSRLAALAVGALGLVGLGGLLLPGAGPALVETAASLADMRLRAPGWLFLLLALPVILRLAWPRLSRQELRPWLALGLRLAGVALLALALAEPYFSQASRAMTVLFVVDRSLSIPEEPGEDPAQPGVVVDLRAQRLLKWINDAVAMRGAGHERDQAGLIVFGRQPRLELPPSDAPRFNLRELPPADDGNYTDIARALKLALASFPEGTGRRVVLVSDGNQNLGDAEEQARLARSLGVQIDVLPLAANRRNTEEVLVERVDAPPVIEQGARVPIRVLVRSHNPNVVAGRLVLRQITDKEGSVTLRLGQDGSLGVEVEPAAGKAKGVRITRVAPDSAAGRAGLEPGEEIVQVDGADVKGPAGLEVLLARRKAGEPVRLTMRRNPVKVVGVRDPARLRPGLNPFSFDRPLTDEQRSYTYEAEFQPLRVEDEKGQLIQKGLPGDRVQNNRASTHVVARGQGRILLLENEAGQHKELVERLVEAGKGRFKVVAEPVDVLDNYKERDKLAVFLSNFDCVIVANVPAERVSEEQQEVIRSNTHDQGCGLVMIGGPEGFGAGGWQGTAIEKALPVDCEIRSLKVQGKGGLVLVMHASEMARGNYWQKRIAKLAVERLGPSDEVGVIDFNFACQWHIPMKEVGPNKADILARIDKMSPGDMPDFGPAFQMAHVALMDRAKDYSAKHIIVISDGDPAAPPPALLRQVKADKITIATVGVATHGAPQDQNLADIASPVKGGNRKRYYKVTDPKQLPAIYIKESRLVSQAFVYRKALLPRLVYRSGPTAKLPELLPLGGFVRTTRKESPLVEVPVVSPQMADTEFPILAYWHYGLGKAVAFTSDAGQPEFWSRPWLAGAAGREGIFAGFWEQVLGWALRPVESGRLVMNTEYRDGKVRVVVEARTPDGRPDTSVRLRAGLTPPAGRGGEPGRKEELRFAQKNAGLYEAEVKAEEAGSYFITAQATRVRKVKREGEREPREVEEALDSVRAGVTLPYSPEFAELESNTPLLDRLREMTDGDSYEEDPELLAEAARSGAVFRPPLTRSRSALPFHYWLLFLAAGLLLLDVAVRRLAFDPHEAAGKARLVWARLRGFPLPPPAPAEAVGRLRARPAEAAQAERAGRRYEGGPVPAPPAVAGGPPRPPAAPAGQAPPAPEQTEPGGLEDLLKAKKRVWEERKGERSEES